MFLWRVETDEDVVEPSVVVTFKFNDFIASGGGSGDANGCLNGLGAGVGEDHLINAWQNGDEFGGEIDFELVLSTQSVAFLNLRRDSCIDGRVIGPEDQWPPCEGVVDVFLIIDVIKVRSVCVGKV